MLVLHEYLEIKGIRPETHLESIFIEQVKWNCWEKVYQYKFGLKSF
jgi:hypothetical protein